MKTRILTAVAGLAVLAVVMAFFDVFVFNLVVAAVCAIGVHEVFQAMGFGKKEWYLFAVMTVYILLLMTVGCTAYYELMLPITVLTMIFFNVCQVAHLKTIDFGKLSGFVYFSAVVILGFYSLIYLKRLLPDEVYGDDAIFFIILSLCFAWGCDTAAYFAGRAFGKHKLAPVVSPKKTVEGAIGGLFGGVVLGVGATMIYHAMGGGAAFMAEDSIRHFVVTGALGAVAAVAGMLGDLFASAVKRQAGIKDYGTIFPGHGGILDRFDSVLFTAPLVCIAVRWFVYL